MWWWWPELSLACNPRAAVMGGRLSWVILHGMTHRVGAKGQVVIPKELRDQLGIEPGDEVNFWLHDDHVAVRPADHRGPLRGRFRGSAMTHELERERAADRAREAAP